MFIQRRTRTQSFLNAYGTDTIDAPNAPQWTDRHEYATRRAAWARRQSSRRSNYDRGTRAGLIGAMLVMAVTFASSFLPASSTAERAAAAWNAEPAKEVVVYSDDVTARTYAPLLVANENETL